MIRVDAVGVTFDGTKWFPILFKDAPLAGIPITPRRLKSVGQHQIGYSSKEEALAAISSDGLLKGVPRINDVIPFGTNPEKIILVKNDLSLAST